MDGLLSVNCRAEVGVVGDSIAGVSDRCKRGLVSWTSDDKVETREDCEGCEGCEDCEGCEGCEDCEGCEGCEDCKGCEGCEDCEGCKDSKGCSLYERFSVV